MLNNPLKYSDPTGHWVETALDIAGLAIDIYQIRQEGWTTVNTIALVVDVVCLVAPVAAGGGVAVRALAHGDDVADAVRAATQVDNVAGAASTASRVDDVADAARAAGQVSPPASVLRSLTRSNYRVNLQPLTGVSDEAMRGMEAHHVLPQALADRFPAGLDVHDPRFGAWVDAKAHRGWSYEYNAKWKAFLDGNPTRDEVLAQARKFAEEYGFDVHFTP